MKTFKKVQQMAKSTRVIGEIFSSKLTLVWDEGAVPACYGAFRARV